GGGTAYIRCLPALEKLSAAATGDQRFGIDIIRRALEAPLFTISHNAGKEGAIVIQTVKSKKGNEGYNALTDEYVDMVSAGVLDPMKVTRSALENAASIASLLLTTEALVAEIPAEKSAAPAAPMGM